MTDQRAVGQSVLGPDEVSTNVRSRNVRLGEAVGEVVRSTLGPKGMDKLLIDPDGMGIVTNDGATILKEMADSPVLNLVREAAKGQAGSAGDGTTMAAVLTGQLLGRADDLLEQGLAPATIVRGYVLALERAEQALDDAALPVDDEVRRDVVTTAMTSKGTTTDTDHLAELVLEAVDRLGADEFDPADVYVDESPGLSVGDSTVVSRVSLENGRVHAEMPGAIEDATLALVEGDVGPTEPTVDATTTVTDFEELQRVTATDTAAVDRVVDALADLDVDMLVTSGHVDESVRGRLAAADIYAVQKVNESTLAQLAAASGASTAREVTELSSDELAGAGRVMEQHVDGEPQTAVERIEDPEAVTVVLHGPVMNLLDELHRALEDGLEAARLTLGDERAVPGGGAAEMVAANAVREYAPTVDDRTQLAVDAFADALEAIPRTLVENAGSDPVDGIVSLRGAHDRGETQTGIDGFTGELCDATEAGVLDPLGVKVGAVQGATDAAVMLLRIDDEIAAAGD